MTWERGGRNDDVYDEYLYGGHDCRRCAACISVYKMVEMDAASRGLKHPKFWGFFAMNGNNSAGLLMYLIGRRRYPVLQMTEEMKMEIEKRKKRAGVGLIFLAVGAIGFVVFLMM